jgi:hypothetical protein
MVTFLWDVQCKMLTVIHKETKEKKHKNFKSDALLGLWIGTCEESSLFATSYGLTEQKT